MAFYRALIAISTPTSTGNQSYTCTDIGGGGNFQPKFVRFTSADRADNSALGDADQVGMVGMSDGTRQNVVAFRQGDNQATTQAVVGRFDTALISIPGVNSATPIVVGALGSFGATSFTVNYTTVDAVAHTIWAEAWGGDEIESVRVDVLDSGTGTGALATTVPNFQPNLLLLATGRRVDSATDAYSIAATSNLGGGATDGTRQWAWATAGDDASAAADTFQIYNDASCIFALDANGAVYLRCTLTSLDATGFTLNRVVNTASMGIQYAAFKLTNGAYVGTDTQKTSAGTQAKTGVGFLPQVLLTHMNRAVNDTAHTVSSNYCMGAAIGTATADQQLIGGGNSDAADPTTCSAHQRTGKILATFATDNASILAEAGLSSFDSDGYTVDWTTADAVARGWVFVAIKGQAAAPPITLGGLHHIGDGMGDTGVAVVPQTLHTIDKGIAA